MTGPELPGIQSLDSLVVSINDKEEIKPINPSSNSGLVGSENFSDNHNSDYPDQLAKSPDKVPKEKISPSMDIVTLG